LAAVTIDPAGNLYGTALGGGDAKCGCGVVYELNSQGVETILHSFNGNDGELPAAPVIRDSLGNLYGTASAYFTGGGVVFQINP
jgi:uncharacterized repeat protein (TIGR03803 family)